MSLLIGALIVVTCHLVGLGIAHVSRWSEDRAITFAFAIAVGALCAVIW